MVHFEDLQIELKLERKTVEFNNTEIQVLQYLPAADKQDIILSTIQKSRLGDESVSEPLLIDIYFHLNLVYSYTNIMFSSEDRINELDLYDKLRTSGLLDLVLQNMDPDEYKELYQLLLESLEKVEKYSNTLVGFLRNAMMNLPQNAERAVEALKGLDPAQFKELADIAKSLNVEIPGLDKIKQ